MIMAKIKKAQAGYKSPWGKRTPDSTAYYNRRAVDNARAAENLRATGQPRSSYSGYEEDMYKDIENIKRQRLKGRPGFDENGNPVTKSSSLSSTGKTAGNVTSKYTKTKTSLKKGGMIMKKAQKGAKFSKNEKAFVEGLDYLKKKNSVKATPKNVGKAAGSLMKKGGAVKKAGCMKCGGKMKKK